MLKLFSPLFLTRLEKMSVSDMSEGMTKLKGNSSQIEMMIAINYLGNFSGKSLQRTVGKMKINKLD